MTEPIKTTLTLEVERDTDCWVTIYCPELRCMSGGGTFGDAFLDFHQEAAESARLRVELGPSSLNAGAKAALATARRIGMAAAEGE